MGTRPCSRTGWSPAPEPRPERPSSPRTTGSGGSRGWTTNVVVPSNFAPFRELPTSHTSPDDAPLLAIPPALARVGPNRTNAARIAEAHRNGGAQRERQFATEQRRPWQMEPGHVPDAE